MNVSLITSCRIVRVGALGLCTGSVALLGGCGIGATAVGGGGAASPMVMTGNVHGGQQPVSHAVVTLYTSGNAGYGLGAKAMAHYSTDATSGNFSFVKSPTGSSNNSDNTWNCPTDGSDPLVYMVAKGGNPNGTADTTGDNSAIALAAALGRCSQVSSSTFVVINEISTAAFATAFAAFVHPDTEVLGSNGSILLSGQSVQGATALTNAFASYNNLVTIANGQAVPANTYAGTGTASGVTVTATPESSKLITFANILAACVNSSSAGGTSTPCTTLFSYAIPPASTTPTAIAASSYATASDTLQAALNMAVNPANSSSSAFTSCGGTATTNAGCLFTLVSGIAPFAGGLSTAPSDWTIGITYTSAGTCNGGSFFNGVAKEAVDASGNVWFINGTGNANTTLGAISPAGQPIYCYATSTTKSGRGLSIDPSGNVWGAFNVPGGLVEIQGGATAVSWTTPSSPYSVVTDPWGNVAYTQVSNGANFIQAVSPGTGTTGNTSSSTWTTVASNLSGAGSGTSVSMLYTAADGLGRMWGTNISTGYTTILAGAIPTTTAVDSLMILGGLATFTTPGGNSLAVGNKVAFYGMTSAAGKTLNYTVGTVTAATALGFTATVSGADAALATETGKVFVPGSAYTVASTSPASTAPIYGLAVDAQGSIYTGSTCCGSGAPYRSFYKTTYSGSAFTTQGSSIFLAGVNGSRSLALDGASNVWAGFELPNDPTNSIYSVGEFYTTTTGGTTTFTNLTPNGAATTCGTSSCTTGGGYFKTGMLEAFDLAVDPAGSVWVLNSSTATTVAATSYTGNSITQVVGAAVPVITPVSAALRSTSLDMKP